jgi:Domain of unknown function (DUF4352)
MEGWSTLGVHVGRFLASVGFVAVAGLAAGCSSSTTVVDHPTGSPSGTLAHVGDTLDLQSQAGKHFQMTLTQVVDPAHGTAKASAPSGKRFVAVVFRVTNTSSQSLSTDANIDTNIVGSNDKTYLPYHQSLSECGNDTTQFNLSAGKSTHACVAFLMRKSVKVAQVQFYPAAGSAKDFGQWFVP